MQLQTDISILNISNLITKITWLNSELISLFKYINIKNLKVSCDLNETSQETLKRLSLLQN